MNPEQIIQIIAMGEGYQAEFKRSVPSKPREIAEDEESGRKSFSWNPLVFGLFNRMRMVEQIGSGIPRVREMMHEAGLPEPEFRYDGMFTVIVKRPVEWSTKRMTLTHVLSENQLKIMDLIYHNSSISKLTLSKELN
jgi:ATP-dependent DNA helicase RecG